MVLTRVGDQRTPWSLCTLLNCLQSRLLQHDLKLGKYFVYVECFNALFFLALDISVLDNFKVGNRNKLYLDIGNASKQKVGVYSLNFLVQFPLKETGRERVGGSGPLLASTTPRIRESSWPPNRVSGSWEPG